MILYHYTTSDAFEDILKSRSLNSSDPLTTMDAAYGEGWYFTDLPPDYCDAWKIAYCWRNINVFNKAECYLKFDIPDEIISKCRKHVYMIKIWDDRIKYLEGKESPECSDGPCKVCKIIREVKKIFNL